jgi:hypothetical protein
LSLPFNPELLLHKKPVVHQLEAVQVRVPATEARALEVQDLEVQDLEVQDPEVQDLEIQVQEAVDLARTVEAREPEVMVRVRELGAARLAQKAVDRVQIMPMAAQETPDQETITILRLLNRPRVWLLCFLLLAKQLSQPAPRHKLLADQVQTLRRVREALEVDKMVAQVLVARLLVIRLLVARLLVARRLVARRLVARRLVDQALVAPHPKDLRQAEVQGPPMVSQALRTMVRTPAHLETS